MDTDDIEWVLDCDLPEVRETAAVYKAPVRTKAECDDYAEEMAEFWGGEYDDVYYYDDEIYYRDYDTNGRMHYLTLSRLDGSFSFWTEDLKVIYDTNECTDLNRAETEAVLAQYGITIPSEAEFLGLVELFPGEPEYQSIIFRADQIPMDRGLLDGTCYVEVTEDGSYLNVNNQLVTYEYHAEEPIRTPEEALKLLQDGCFGNGWRYDAHLFGEFSVQSCSLSYALDTKGFYQPVYYFEVTGNNWNGTAVIMIPAIA